MAEHDEQVAVIDWALSLEGAYPELALLHSTPNGAKLPYMKNGKGKRYSPEAIKLKREGLKPGVPDLKLPVARDGFHGLYIEMKYGKNQPTEDQVWWLDRLSEQGYLAVVCYGAEHAIFTICDYLGIPRPEFLFSDGITIYDI